MLESESIKVFQYWGQGEDSMPEFLKKIYKHNQKICEENNIELILIDDNNVNNFIIPHPRYQELAYNHKSDIIRYYLLDKFGGFWFDTDVIIVKSLVDLYKKITENNYECMLDIEFCLKIGCASLYVKKNSTISKFCLEYVNSILEKNQKLNWDDIGPHTVELLYRKHYNLILLNNHNTVKKGCNFICWNEYPGINKQNWYLETEDKAKEKANKLRNNISCFYLITWTIYRINDLGDELCKSVFDDKKSVFSYFINQINNKPQNEIENILSKLEMNKTKPKKKYAVMWASTINIGDDIQTLAAINFLKKKKCVENVICIDRESLSDYQGEPVTMIMNGWYMHNIHKFPPSDKITPIFISVHISNEKLISNNISYFKKFEPIGCRDLHSVTLFKKYNINAYFTGCLTLLFDDFIEKEEGKYLVDVNTKCNYIPNINIDTSIFSGFNLIEHDIDTNLRFNINKRLEMATELLDKYRKADLVITTRLHCILPCRAFNTQAIFMHKNYQNDPRFQGLHKVINGGTGLNNNIHGNRECIEEIRKKFLSIDI